MGCCGLTKYGVRELVLSTVAAGGLCAMAFAAAPLWVAIPLAALPTILWLWVLWFFRDPERIPPGDDGSFVSPADGNVTDITPLGASSLLEREGTQIGIFMNVFSVHVNRCPLDASVVRVEHKDGAYIDVRQQAGWEQNESATIFLTHTRAGVAYPVVVRQVAGLIARRIITDLSPGEALVRGQRIGMIKFGSRMELLLPRELAGQVCVSLGQAVRAGETVLVKAAEIPA